MGIDFYRSFWADAGGQRHQHARRAHTFAYAPVQAADFDDVNQWMADRLHDRWT